MNSDTWYDAGTVKILIVDDHPIVREGMMMFLNAQRGRYRCWAAADAQEGLAEAKAQEVALVVVDISLRGESGLSLIKTLRLHRPSLAILAMSLHDESIFAERALRAGANGYLMKQEATASILAAVQVVLEGKTYLSAAMQKRLARAKASPAMSDEREAQHPIAGLTQHEFEVFHLLGQGFGPRQISEKLCRSVKTIETYLARLRVKLQLATGKELAHYATQWLNTR